MVTLLHHLRNQYYTGKFTPFSTLQNTPPHPSPITKDHPTDTCSKAMWPLYLSPVTPFTKIGMGEGENRGTGERGTGNKKQQSLTPYTAISTASSPVTQPFGLCQEGPQGGLSGEQHSSSPPAGKARTGAIVNRHAGSAEGSLGSTPLSSPPKASIKDSPAVSTATAKLCGRKKEAPAGRPPRQVKRWQQTLCPGSTSTSAGALSLQTDTLFGHRG